MRSGPRDPGRFMALCAAFLGAGSALLAGPPQSMDATDAVRQVSVDPAPLLPPEVPNFHFADEETLAWNAAAGADFYNIYRGDLAGLASGTPPQCHAHGILSTFFDSPKVPAAGRIFVYLATGESFADGEGSAGTTSSGQSRSLRGACTTVVRSHMLNRTGFGWGEWSAGRIQTLGIDAYMDEQLNPASIDESGNTSLASRLAPFDPPADIFELIGRQVVSAVYARRQLEQVMAVFWTNHFNTFWFKVVQTFQGFYPPCGPGAPASCDPAFPQVADLEGSLAQHREMEDFRSLAFNGSFREIVQASALSPAMIIYLDSYRNINLRPNENYARELLELFAMGVNGGYTQTDVEELARILTGWTICKKALADVNNPTAPCISSYWLSTPAGDWTAHFDMSFVRPGVRRHDCGAKTLFAGTPQEIHFPATPCLNAQEGVDEFHAALDAIVAHPSTPRFIVGKMLQQLVTDAPPQEMIDLLVAEWNDAGNPAGVGDLRAVTRAALDLADFRSPDQIGSKVKTPLEHFSSALRGLRGTTDGVSVILNYLVSAQHIPHYNDIPTGYSELGSDWIDTNNTLTRQNFGLQLSSSSSAGFGSDPIGLLAANGVSTAPGNAPAIVDFLAKVLLAGALTPAERQRAIDFLNTDDNGAVSPYNTARIRETAGLLLGYAQFQEQ